MSKKHARQSYSDLFTRPKPPATTLPYRVHCVGRIRNQPYHITLGTYHDDVMFLLFLGGQGVYKCGEKVIQTMPVTAGFIFPSQDTGLLRAIPSDPYDHYYCRFTGDYAKQVARRIVTEKSDGQVFFDWKNWKEGAAILQRMTDMWKYHRRDGADRMNLIDAYLTELLVLLDSQEVSKTPQLMAVTLENYMQNHISEHPSLQEIADYFCVSRYHICRAAKKCLGEPLVQRWERMKVDWAITLLAEPSMSVQQIARHVGYEDAFYFSRVFKNHTGLCPRSWRKEHSR